MVAPSNGAPSTRWAQTRRWARSSGLMTQLSLVWVAMITFAAVFADVLPIRDPEELGIRTGDVARYESPGANAWFGGDESGRDLFAYVVHGARPALLLAIVVILLASMVGSLLGVVAAFAGGRVDRAIMTTVDIALAFPALILLAAVLGTFGRELWVLTAILAILGVPSYARLVRGVTLSLVEREFVEAARSMGAGRWRLIRHEIAPNVVLVVMQLAFLGIAVVIATEGGLAFLGLSIDQPTWGALIARGSTSLREASHVALIPATVMFLTILAFNLIGDSLRVFTDPRAAFGRIKPVAVAPTPSLARAADIPTSTALLQIERLVTDLPTPFGPVRAVDGVSLEVEAGTVLGIVGESGCGKTMLLRSILDTFPIAGVARSGSIRLGGTELIGTDDATRRRILGTEVGAVFQNPLTALNPVRTIGTQISEPMRVHRGLSKAEARARAIELLGEVGIPEPRRRVDQYPHQLSGGMRQRVTIAIALANEPRILLADEPTTALDVTVQDQILTLLATLCRERDMALVLVTHDLAVVRGWTDRVAVMYAGKIVESAPTGELFAAPRHRYTEALLRSIPRLDLPPHRTLETIEGQPPLLLLPPPGCRFAARCAHADERCGTDEPPSASFGSDHVASCWHPAELRDAAEVLGGR